MIILLSYIDKVHLSMYLLKNGPASNCFWATTESTASKNNKTKNKMESSTAFSTIYHPLSVRVNTPLAFKVSCAGSSYVHASGAVRGIRNLSKELSENKFMKSSYFYFQGLQTVRETFLFH